jgi:small subunit ribosomal protein S1
VLEVDIEKERVGLGIKQLGEDPFASAAGDLKKGSIVTCTVTAVTDGGIEVEVADGLTGFIRKSDLSRDRSEQRRDRFAVGEKVDARITNIDKRDRRLSLSVKAREIAEEKEAMAQYGSSDSGASLGEILGPAINRAQTPEEESAEESAEESDDEDSAKDDDTEAKTAEGAEKTST